MATTRINGVRYQLHNLTVLELDALEKMAHQRIEDSLTDLDKIKAEKTRRDIEQACLFTN